MIVKREKLKDYLDKRKFTRAEFAKQLGVEVSEVDKLLNGERVEQDTAHKLIYFFKAELAQHYIDWQATGVKNPLAEDNGNK